MRRAALALALAACGSRSPGIDAERAATVFDRVPIATDNGLSGLAVDDAGAIWTESERDLSVSRIVLDPSGTRAATTVRYEIAGAPEGADLEALAWLGPGVLAFGTEGRTDDRAQVLIAAIDEAAHRVTITRAIELPEDALGLPVKPNDGVEGLCGRGDELIAAIESTATDARGRWAPLVRIDVRTGAIAVTRMALTSDKGKLSALDCTIDADGNAHLVAIERHFAITRILRAELPRAAPARVEPTVAIDLAPVLRGSLNLEGIGVLRDGRVVAVVDNQYDRITGPNELLVFKPRAVP